MGKYFTKTSSKATKGLEIAEDIIQKARRAKKARKLARAAKGELVPREDLVDLIQRNRRTFRSGYRILPD